MKRTKRKETRKRKNIHNTFSSPSVWSGLFFFFFLSSFSWILAHTSTCHQALPNITASDPPAPHPTLLLPAKLQKVRTWLRTRGCGGRCSARSLRSPFWCGTPGRTPAEETQNRSLSTFKILQTISGQRSETGGKLNSYRWKHGWNTVLNSCETSSSTKTQKLPRSKSSLSWQKYEILGAYFYNREVQRVDRKWHGDLLNQASYGTVHSPLTEKPLANSMDDLRRL